MASVAVIAGFMGCGSERTPLSAEADTSLPDSGGDVDTDVRLCPSNDCLPFHLDCNGDAADGCEANTRTDVANCGGCGITCAGDDASLPPNTKLACVEGKCVHLCANIVTPRGTAVMRICSGDDPMYSDPIRGCPNGIACDPCNGG